MWGRRRRAEALTELQLEALIADLGRGMWRQVRAYRKLARAKSPEAGEYFVRTFLNHPSEHVRASMLHLIPKADAQRRLDLVYRGLGDAHTAVRMVAVSILAEEGNPSALPALADAFWDAHSRVMILVPGEGGAGFECPHFGEHYLAGRCAEAIAAIAERGSATARCWAISFLRNALQQWPEASERFQLALRRVERAAAGDLPRPAATPPSDGRQLPLPERHRD